MRYSAISAWLHMAANKRAVDPSADVALTLQLAVSTKYSTMSLFPLAAAMCRGVYPS